jgi:hypothetical protein
VAAILISEQDVVSGTASSLFSNRLFDRLWCDED